MNPLLLIDTYKATHLQQIPKEMTKSVSYFIPRGSRIPIWDNVVFFGLQAFIKKYLIDYFRDHFFNKPEEYVVNEYINHMECVLPGVVNAEPIRKLHNLGYLPIEIVALEEGSVVPVKVPLFAITNTHPDFAWLPQALESLISAELWYPIVCATVGKTYRDIVNKYYEETCDPDLKETKALSNFDFRGDMNLEAALTAASGWLLSFENTSTVPAIKYLEKYYNADPTHVGRGAISTEHFTVCSNYAIDGDERTFLKRLLTEIYPDNSFSCVCDSYDYWNVVDNIIPSLKDEILNHNGTFLVRGDSGDPVEVVTETVFHLWETFGGTINSKGYKVLNPHIKAIYGDSITPQRCEQIYAILQGHGFAASNVALGVGSFSMHAMEIDGELYPFTRDTFQVKIAPQYMETSNGTGYPIFKAPKGCEFKKSYKGCCFVTQDWSGKYICEDGLTWKEANHALNHLQPIFKDGHLLKESNLYEIRNRLHKFNF